MSEKARDYASARGGSTMIYPPVIEPRPEGFSNVWPLWAGVLHGQRNARLAELLAQVFGRWPGKN